MNKLEFALIDDMQIWQRLLARSPQATRFLHPDFLELFGVPFRFYGVFRGGVCIMGLPVIEGPPLPWCYRQGPIFYDEISKGLPAKTVQYEVDLAEFAVTELAKHEAHFRFSLSPSLRDVRGYDWAHYHDGDKPRCTINPRYTAVFPLEGETCESLRSQGRSARRQEERYAKERELLTPDNSGTTAELFDLYTQTFARQGSDIPANEAALFAPYIEHFVSAGCGHILTVRDSNGTPVAAAFVFADTDGVWHVPIIGTSETRYGGTMLYYQILDFALAHGGSAVDFDGANSPNRGYFKHSLGAMPELYFEVSYDGQ